MILPAWFDFLVERFSFNEVQIKKFSLLLKNSYPPAKTVNKTPTMTM